MKETQHADSRRHGQRVSAVLDKSFVHPHGTATASQLSSLQMAELELPFTKSPHAFVGESKLSLSSPDLETSLVDLLHELHEHTLLLHT